MNSIELLRIKHQMMIIPMSSEYKANRYDTDNQYVIHLWDNNGNSYDLRINK